MPAQLGRGPNLKKFLLYAIAATSCAIFLGPSAKAYTTWTITIDVTKGADPPTYTFNYYPLTPAPNCPGLPPMSAQKAEMLHICPGDKVEWSIKTIGSGGSVTIHQNRGFQPSGSDKWFRPGPISLANVVSNST